MCIMCLRAIMNYQVGVGGIRGDPPGAPPGSPAPAASGWDRLCIPRGWDVNLLPAGMRHGGVPRSWSVSGGTHDPINAPFHPPSLASAW